MNIRTLAGGAVSCVAWVLVLTGLAHSQEYSIRRLDPPSANFGNFSTGVAINEDGTVLGSGSAQFTTDLILTWATGQTIGSQHYFYGYNRTQPEGLNDLGDYVGHGPDNNSKTHGFINSVDLGIGYTNDINNQRQVVGWTFDSLYIWKDGVFDYLPTSYWGSEALSINDSGVAAGYWYTDCTADCYSEVCIFEGDSLVLLGRPSGIYAEGWDINNNRQIAGYACVDVDCTEWRGFIWNNGSWTIIPTLGGRGSSGNAINDAGVVVGESYAGGTTQTAIMFDTINGLRNLNDLIPPGSGWELISASDINNRGQIVGTGKHNGLTRAFLLTPPFTLVLKDINGDLIRNATVKISRIRNDPPFFSAYWTEEATSDDQGEVQVTSNTLVPGDSLRVSMVVHSEPAVKHQGLLGTMYTLYLDNMVIGSDSKPTFPMVGEGTQEVIMHHATVAWNFVVSVEWAARTDYHTTLQAGIRGMANSLFDVSDGQMRLDTIMIFDNGTNWASADIRIHASNIQWPKTYYDSIQGLGGPVLMPRKWFGNSAACRNGSFAENPLNLSDSVNYTTLGHEIGHYALGLADEYVFPGGGTRCGNVPNYGFMDTQYPFPWNGPYRSELSTANRYALAPCQNNRHWSVRGMSCWDWVHQQFEKYYTYGFDSVYVPMKRPQDRNLPPSQDYLTGPNDVLTAPDYDVGAMAVFPVSPPGGIAYTFPVTVTNVATGARLGDVNVTATLAGSGRTLNQGNTSDSGQIQIIGCNVADTINVAGRFAVGAPTLAASASYSGVQWVSFSSDLFDVLRNASIVEARPLSESFQMNFLAGWAGDTARVRILLPDTLPSAPALVLEADGAESTLTISWTGAEYAADLGANRPPEGTVRLSSADDSGYAFFVPNGYTISSYDSLALSQPMWGPGGNSQFTPESGHVGLRSVMLLESFFPVLRDGLSPEQVQAGPAVGLALKELATLPGDNPLVIRYDDALLSSLDPTLENTLTIWEWDETLDLWVELGGTVDTTHDEVTASISRSGLYAAFATPQPTGIGDAGDAIRPTSYALMQNFPNPFNASTQIEFTLPQAGRVNVRVWNILGQPVKTLVDEHRVAGRHQVIWDGTDQTGASVASGMYLYRIQVGDFVAARKMLLLK